MEFKPQSIYYEPKALLYQSAVFLREKYHDVPWIPIENHNNIPHFREQSNKEFPKMKKNLIVGIRKTHRYTENHKTSDYLVPYTSSGCTASCLYCYLVCNYNKCSYLRLFVNREQMLEKLIAFSKKQEHDLTYEIGSNSDLVLENTITQNLTWTIENFAKEGKGFLTFPTKFDMVSPILNANHQGKTIVRMSVNPQEIIQKVEFGTASLSRRIQAIHLLKEAGYNVGILIAPVILIDNWKELYSNLLIELANQLTEREKNELWIEIIFMTYSYIHRMINQEAFPNAINLYDKDKMIGRGRGKYSYSPSARKEAETLFKEMIPKLFKSATIKYIV